MSDVYKKTVRGENLYFIVVFKEKNIILIAFYSL